LLEKTIPRAPRVYFHVETQYYRLHGCIQQEKVIVSINPSYMHDFINVNLDKKLQVPGKNIQSTQVEGENVQVFKYLKAYHG
jgi:hypothetical protein